ncbi:MAG TPA: hypothetical protein VF469_17975 [Kofleriaceae bacterium]
MMSSISVQCRCGQVRGRLEDASPETVNRVVCMCADCQAKSAIGTPPPGSEKISLRMLGRVLRLIVGWRLRGKAWPHPFFDRGAKAPNRPMTTLSTSEREALRPLCGPKPAAP